MLFIRTIAHASCSSRCLLASWNGSNQKAYYTAVKTTHSNMLSYTSDLLLCTVSTNFLILTRLWVCGFFYIKHQVCTEEAMTWCSELQKWVSAILICGYRCLIGTCTEWTWVYPNLQWNTPLKTYNKINMAYSIGFTDK